MSRYKSERGIRRKFKLSDHRNWMKQNTRRDKELGNTGERYKGKRTEKYTDRWWGEWKQQRNTAGTKRCNKTGEAKVDTKHMRRGRSTTGNTARTETDTQSQDTQTWHWKRITNTWQTRYRGSERYTGWGDYGDERTQGQEEITRPKVSELRKKRLNTDRKFISTKRLNWTNRDQEHKSMSEITTRFKSAKNSKHWVKHCFSFCLLFQVYAKLSEVPDMDVYAREEIPERFHYKKGKFVSPLTLVAEPGWFIAPVMDNLPWS